MTPLALKMLLWFASRDPAPFPNVELRPQQEILRRFRDEGIVQVGTIVDQPHITARGEAWLAMILETPMPVQQWIDPRGTAPVAHAGQFSGVDLERIRSALAGEVVFVDRPDLIDAPAIPEGFAPWMGYGAAPGTQPPNLPDEVEVVYRNGAIKRLFTSQVPWSWPLPTDKDNDAAKTAKLRAKAKPFEVVGYRPVTNPDDSLRGSGLRE